MYTFHSNLRCLADGCVGERVCPCLDDDEDETEEEAGDDPLGHASSGPKVHDLQRILHLQQIRLVNSSVLSTLSDLGHFGNWTKILYCPMSSGASE